MKSLLMSQFYLDESFYTVEKINYIYILLVKICRHLNIDTSQISSFFNLKNSDYLDLQLLITSKANTSEKAWQISLMHLIMQ